MTAFFQTYLGTGFGWFVGNLIFILLIALPLMLAVAMIIYADRKIWAAMALRRGPNVVGPIETSVAGVRLGARYFFVLVEGGDVTRWCPVEKVPMGGTRLHDYLVFRTPSYVEVQQDRVTDEAQIARHAPDRSAQDVKDRADTARELNRDLEHYVATGSSISQAKAQVRAAHEDVLVEMVLGVTRIVQTMATQGAMLEDAVVEMRTRVGKTS